MEKAKKPTNNEPVPPAELRRTLAYLGAQLKRHEEVLNATQTQIERLVKLVAHDHKLFEALAGQPVPTKDRKGLN